MMSMSQFFTFASLSVFLCFCQLFFQLHVCYNFFHYCTKFQTEKIKLVSENYKKRFFAFLGRSSFYTTFLYMSIPCIFFDNGAHINCLIIFKLKAVGNNFNCDTNLLMSNPRCKVMQIKYHHLYCDSSLAMELCHSKTSKKHLAQQHTFRSQADQIFFDGIFFLSRIIDAQFFLFLISLLFSKTTQTGFNFFCSLIF